jgi:hypothetical protein
MGDKFRSRMDAGLAFVQMRDKTGNAITWSNSYTIGIDSPHKRLIRLDTWPLPADATEFWLRDWRVLKGSFIICKSVKCTFVSWNGQDVSELDRVLFRERRPKERDWGGGKFMEEW